VELELALFRGVLVEGIVERFHGPDDVVEMREELK